MMGGRGGKEGGREDPLFTKKPKEECHFVDGQQVSKYTIPNENTYIHAS